MVDPVAAFSPTAGMVVGYILVTIAFLVVGGLVFWKVQALESRLILLGLVVAVADIGYSGLVSGGAMIPAQTMMKIGFLLVLGGVACSVFGYLDRMKPDKAQPTEGGHETQA